MITTSCSWASRLLSSVTATSAGAFTSSSHDVMRSWWRPVTPIGTRSWCTITTRFSISVCTAWLASTTGTFIATAPAVGGAESPNDSKVGLGMRSELRTQISASE